MPKGKTLLFSLSKDAGDFVIESFTSGGPGGQARQHNQQGIRIRHPESGAVSTCTEERSQEANKRKAFRRLLATPTFQTWHRVRTAMAMKGVVDMERELNRLVDESMADENLRVEVYDAQRGQWVPAER